MMGLVEYDYDSNSEPEDQEEPSSSVVLVKPTVQEQAEEPIETSSDLFAKLPESKPKATSNTPPLEDDVIEDFIPKVQPPKPKEKVKITIPLLSSFEPKEDEYEPSKKKVKSAKGSGLMALLPPVKGTLLTAKSFVPKVLTNKPKTPAKSAHLVPHAVRKNAEAIKTATIKKLTNPSKVSKASSSDVESDDDIETPETFDDDMWEKVCGRKKPKPKPIINSQPVVTSFEETVDIAPEAEAPYEGLDNKAFKELVGSTKRPLGNIKLIDVNEEEVLGEKDLWMTKSLTDPESVPKGKVENPVDPTRRKRHHITYLAEQAKANEQELQSTWSASKNNRLATRAKYGF